MKAGLVTSVTLHALLLGVGLVSLSAPRAYEVADVEALPVDIVPVDTLTQIQAGEKKAPPAPRPTPKPTERPDPVENAQKVGEADIDLDTPPTPEAKPKPVEKSAEPAPAPKPQPKPVEKPAEEIKQAEAKPEPAPQPEREPEAQPRQEVTLEPTPEPLVAENPVEENVTLPQSAPVPQSRPNPPQPKIAKAPDRQEAEQAAPKQAQRSEQKEEELFDEVAALLNKEKSSGGGAKRSREEASLGGERTTTGETLTQSEMDALRGQIQRCWNVPAGALDAENLRVSVKFKLDPSGSIEGRPEIIAGGNGSSVERAAAESARRAILQCAPYNLPSDKYSAWADVIVNFDPTDMF